jgi:hypothetical protein
MTLGTTGTAAGIAEEGIATGATAMLTAGVAAAPGPAFGLITISLCETRAGKPVSGAGGIVAAAGLTGVDAIALTQFSLARAHPGVASASGKPVLTTPDSAVRKLQRLLLRKEAA